MYYSSSDILRDIESAASEAEVVTICRAALEAEFLVAPVKGLRIRYDLGLGTTKKFLDSLVYLNDEEATAYLTDLANAAFAAAAKRADYERSLTPKPRRLCP